MEGVVCHNASPEISQSEVRGHTGVSRMTPAAVENGTCEAYATGFVAGVLGISKA